MIIAALLALSFPQDGDPVDPRKEAPKLCKVLEKGAAQEREEALATLIEFGDVAHSRTRSTLKRLKSNWLRTYQKSLFTTLQKIRNARPTGKIDELRKKSKQMLGEKRNKEMKPVVEEMIRLFFPDLTVARTDEKVVEARDRLVEIEGMLGRINEKTEDIQAAIAKLRDDLEERTFASMMPARDARTVIKNRKLGKEIQEKEYAFVKLLNRYRLALGINACEIDVKLCKAARGHSKDMKEKNFFSHTSPIPGKQTPQARAAKEGTGCSSENITRTGPTPENAFWSWFDSTAGHHENMVTPWPRVGIGNHAEMWTCNF